MYYQLMNIKAALLKFFKPNTAKIIIMICVFILGFLLLQATFASNGFDNDPQTLKAIIGIFLHTLMAIPIYLSLFIASLVGASGLKFIPLIAFINIFWSYFLACVFYFLYHRVQEVRSRRKRVV